MFCFIPLSVSVHCLQPFVSPLGWGNPKCIAWDEGFWDMTMTCRGIANMNKYRTCWYSKVYVIEGFILSLWMISAHMVHLVWMLMVFFGFFFVCFGCWFWGFCFFKVVYFERNPISSERKFLLWNLNEHLRMATVGKIHTASQSLVKSQCTSSFPL